MSDIQFWDMAYAQSSYSRELNMSVLESALSHFGNVRGKSIIEIGCGPGSTAFYFGSKGANVIGVDISRNAIDDLNAFCNKNRISNVQGICANILDMGSVEPVDFVFGSMILHHIEPFGKFADQLRRMLKPGGKAFFWENNANSRLLMWLRQNMVGKLWTPKYGDRAEFPLTPGEIDQLRQRFQVHIECPEMVFFRLISLYLLRNHIEAFTRALDEFFYRRKWLLRYSYRQYVLIDG